MEKRLVEPIETMTLSTVNIFRKYIALADVNFVWIDEFSSFKFNFIEAYQTLALHET